MLTLTIIMVEPAAFTRILAVLFVLGAMVFKSAIIGGGFMHLRLERKTLVIPLVLATLITTIVLFGLIPVDGAAAHGLAE